MGQGGSPPPLSYTNRSYYSKKSIQKVSVPDPESGTGTFVIPGSGSGILDGEKTRSGMNIADFIFENLLSVFCVKNT